MKCPVCSSTNLTCEGGLSSYHLTSIGSVSFHNKKQGLFSGDYMFDIKKCRICQDCGYVLTFLGNKDIENLKNNINNIEPPKDI